MLKILRLSLLVIVLTVCVRMIASRQFGKCELASELLKNGIPYHQIPKWLCIMEHESRMKTDAKNVYNSDRSNDHGIFQINDRYWCSPGGANVCRIPCYKLRDNDISDDIKCAKKIYQVHGFYAWVVYRSKCENQNLSHYSRACRYRPFK